MSDTPPEVLGVNVADTDSRRMELCADCAIKADFGMQTGRGVNIPKKFTCEGCERDVTFIVSAPRTPERLLLLESRLAVEEEDANR